MSAQAPLQPNEGVGVTWVVLQQRLRLLTHGSINRSTSRPLFFLIAWKCPMAGTRFCTSWQTFGFRPSSLLSAEHVMYPHQGNTQQIFTPLEAIRQCVLLGKTNAPDAVSGRCFDQQRRPCL